LLSLVRAYRRRVFERERSEKAAGVRKERAG
jgi:hypothetical protein